VGFAAVSLFGPTVIFLQEVVGLSAALAGLLISIPNLSGSLLRIPFAAMVEKDGGRRPFLALLLLSLFGIVGIWLVMIQPVETIAGLFPLLLGLGVLGGCGIATFSVGIGQTSYWFPQKRQGTALGVYAGVGNLAPGIFALILTGLTIPRLGLPGSYLLWSIFLALGIVAYIFTGRNAWFFQYRRAGLSDSDAKAQAAKDGQELFPTGKAVESLKASAKIPQTWMLVLVYFTTFGGFLALTAWLPKFGIGYLGFELGTAGLLTAAYSIGASLLRVAGGSFSDLFGGRKTALFSLAAGLVGSFLVIFLPAGVGTIAGLLIMALGMGVGNAAVFKLVPHYVPKAVGGAAGWIGGLGAFGGFVIPLSLGAVLDSAGYAQGFWIFAGLFILALVMILTLDGKTKEK
jgi:NNP family nitrate/nitrite transporter-like MFS transporter